jgi:hypothetical protein
MWTVGGEQARSDVALARDRKKRQPGHVPETPIFHGPKDYLDLARSPEAWPDQLRDLVRSPYPFVMEAVAGHPSTPVDALISLVPAEIRTWNDGAIVVALVRNPTTPVEVLCRIPELVLPRLAVRDDQKAFRAGVALAERHDTPDEVLRNMVDDPRATTEFRKVVARDTTRPRLREQLLLDRSERVRRAAARGLPEVT